MTRRASSGVRIVGQILGNSRNRASQSSVSPLSFMSNTSCFRTGVPTSPASSRRLRGALIRQEWNFALLWSLCLITASRTKTQRYNSLSLFGSSRTVPRKAASASEALPFLSWLWTFSSRTSRDLAAFGWSMSGNSSIMRSDNLKAQAVLTETGIFCLNLSLN